MIEDERRDHGQTLSLLAMFGLEADGSLKMPFPLLTCPGVSLRRGIYIHLARKGQPDGMSQANTQHRDPSDESQENWCMAVNE